MEKEPKISNLENALGYGIKLGVPIKLKDFPQLRVPNNPHVFYVQKIRLLEKDKNVGELERVMIMLGHAIVIGKNLEDWRFVGTLNSVQDTVKAYEKHSQQLCLPNLDCILACRNDSIFNRNSKAKLIFSRGTSPYVVPVKGRVVLTFPSSPEERFMMVEEEKGVGLIVAKADKWGSVDIWRKHRTVAHPEQKIPLWALRASM